MNKVLRSLTYAVAWKAENLLEFVGGLGEFSLKQSLKKENGIPTRAFQAN